MKAHIMSRRFPRYISVAMIVSAFATITPASAETPLGYSVDGNTLFTVDVPDFWQMRSGGERELTDPEIDATMTMSRVIALQPVTETGVWMGFMVPAGVATLDDGREYLRELGQFLALDVAMSAPESLTIDGRPALSSRGNGMRDGRDVQLTLVLIDLPGPRVAIAAVVTELSIDLSWYPVVNKVLTSLRIGG